MTVRGTAPRCAGGLRVADPREKVAAVHALATAALRPTRKLIATPATFPVARALPRLVRPADLGRAARRDSGGARGPAAFDRPHRVQRHRPRTRRHLALPGRAAGYYLDWLRVADEEASHFTLVCGRLLAYACILRGFRRAQRLVGMAERRRTTCSPAWRRAPHTRSPRTRRLAVGSGEAGRRGRRRVRARHRVILRDEIVHVAIGNRWFRFLCGVSRARSPPGLRRSLIRHSAPRLHGPFSSQPGAPRVRRDGIACARTLIPIRPTVGQQTARSLPRGIDSRRALVEFSSHRGTMNWSTLLSTPIGQLLAARRSNSTVAKPGSHPSEPRCAAPDCA